MHEALKSAAQLALRPYTNRGWTIQMSCATDTDCTVLYGRVDMDSGEEEGVRVTTSLIRTATEQKVAIKVDHI